MKTHVLTISYPEDLLFSLKETPESFESEARLMLAVKLYELNRISTGMAAKLAGMSRAAFIFALDRFGLSPMGVDASELAEDFHNA
jgi:predicted HTH domain antitoxin